MIKFLVPIGLVIVSTANSAPCYTDTKDGCDNSSVTIFVKTKSTENGFCSEYINEQKQKVVRCYTTPPPSPEPTPEIKNVVNTPSPPQQNPPIITPVIYQNQQINNYNSDNDDNNYNQNERVGYWEGYWNSRNSYQGGYPNRPPYPPQNHRPPRPRPPVIVAPSAPIGQKHNGSRLQSAVPANTHNRPNYQRPPRPHRPQGNVPNRDDRPRSSAPLKR